MEALGFLQPKELLLLPGPSLGPGRGYVDEGLPLVHTRRLPISTGAAPRFV